MCERNLIAKVSVAKKNCPWERGLTSSMCRQTTRACKAKVVISFQVNSVLPLCPMFVKPSIFLQKYTLCNRSHKEPGDSYCLFNFLKIVNVFFPTAHT